jgi:hypothetical protein
MYCPPRVGSRETKGRDSTPTTPSLVGKLRFPYDPFLFSFDYVPYNTL